MITLITIITISSAKSSLFLLPSGFRGKVDKSQIVQFTSNEDESSTIVTFNGSIGPMFKKNCSSTHLTDPSFTIEPYRAVSWSSVLPFALLAAVIHQVYQSYTQS
jgi:hypothetical protein